MNNSQKRRMWIVLIGLMIVTVVIIGRLIQFQIVKGPEWADRASDEVVVIAQPERGTIYDRHGTILAANTSDYQISVAPNLVDDPRELAVELTSVLQKPMFEIEAALDSDLPFVMLEGRVAPEVADLVRDVQRDYNGVQIDPMPRRFYPQGELLCHVLGYVDFNNNGGSGLEGYYQSELAGEAASARQKISPIEPQVGVVPREGADLVMTIDRSVQYLVEEHLRRAIQEYRATGGTIIVMDPRTGAVLAMANDPCFDPYKFFETQDDALLKNPTVSNQFEPGSVMKLITMAAALDSGTVTPQTTYYDAGVLEVGGHRTYNWDRSANGTTDMTTLLARSLNVGAATIATWMGPDVFNDYLRQFGFGSPTGIDLLAEAAGTMPLPGDALWTESFLATYAYGQSIAVTPLQMITAVSALANDGEIMQPYVVEAIKRGDEVLYQHEPTVMSKPISAETAEQVTNMAVTAVAREVYEAQVAGYTIAGKTGTAQIAENGIYIDDTIGTFVGWLPADDPEIIIYVKIDRPQSSQWGSQTAAPVFNELTNELVVLLGIPPDNIRLNAEIFAARGAE